MKRVRNTQGGARLAPITLAVFAMVGMVPMATAQTPEAEEATRLDAVQVTGSRIGRVDFEGPSPVISITREAIDNAGYLSVGDVLEDLAQNSGSASTRGGLFGTNGGTSTVNLRGFGAGRTLVLLDSRRLPVYPNDITGNQPVDLTSIPFSSIERIEILTSGASAIYGSDAVGGVVNIITKKGHDGRALTVRGGGTEDGGGSDLRLQYFDGFALDGGSVTFTADFYEQKQLKLSDRSFSESDFTGSPTGGSLFGSNFAPSDGSPIIPDPNCGQPNDSLGGLGVLVGDRCRFDRTAFRQWLPDHRSSAFSIRLDRELGSVTNFARAYFYESKTIGQAEPNAYGGGEGFRPGRSQLIPSSEHNFGEVPAGAPNNPTTGTANEVAGSFQRRLVEFGPRIQDSRTQVLSVQTGLAGFIGDYAWDTGLTFSQVRLSGERPNILSSLLDNEVSNNGLDLFQPISQDVIDRFSFLSTRSSLSQSVLFDGTVTGNLPLELPGGVTQFAAHVDLEQQRYTDNVDAITALGDAFDGGLSGGGDRKYAAFGVEVLFPVATAVEVTVAGRYDRYFDDSNVSGAFSPQLGVAWRPIDSLLVRGSAGTSFRAPSLQDLFGGQSTTFASVNDPNYCLAQGGTPNDSNSAIPACNPTNGLFTIQSAQVLSGSSPDLEEEEGRSYGVGIVWEALDNLSFTVDYYDIELENIVSTLSAQQILNNCAFNNQFCDRISVDYVNGVDTNNDGQLLDEPGQQIQVVNQNLAFQAIKGIDFGANYTIASPIGRFKTDMNVAWIRSLKQQSLPSSPVEEVINSTPSTGSRAPEYRATWNVDWSRDSVGVTVGGKFIDGIPGDFLPSGLSNVPSSQENPSFTTWDVQARYDMGSFGVIRAGVENIFDRQFPLDPSAVGGLYGLQFIVGSALGYVDTLGRSGYLQYEYRF